MKWSALALMAVTACSSAPTARVAGQTDFVSAPPGGSGVASFPRGGGATDAAGNATPKAGTPAPAATPARTVEETDLYRLEGDRLYYLNGYRGLMVFDVSDVDHPVMLGRSPIFGSPVDMIVRNGVAIVVVADWYGQLDDGTPFHGSIVRGLDATDPANITVLGEAKLGGWVLDDRVVGDVIYAVSQDYGWFYGWDAVSTAQTTPGVVVSSVSFANNAIAAVGRVDFPGYTGIFNVTPSSILLAHDGPPGANGVPSNQTQLLYLDISDPEGRIVQRGALTVNGQVQGWGADNGRWNLDFADGKIAHVVGCAAGSFGYCDGTSGYVLSIADFTNPDAPALAAQLTIPSPGWGAAAARFDVNRLYLSPQGYYAYGTNLSTPFLVYDLTNAKAPKLAGRLEVPGSVWNILPAPGSRLFALGDDFAAATNGEAVSLKYLDVTNPASPQLLGTSTFGSGWAWTPAAGTFKAFTMDATQGLVVLPFSGWSNDVQQYNDGLQLIDFTASTITTGGAALTRGWVERGIFVKNRLVSLSDLSLAVVDYTNHAAPVVTTELTLARNVITAQPQGSNIAEISSDWWNNDLSWSEVRLVPLANAEETSDASNAPTVRVAGVNAQVFMNGSLAYVVTDVRVPAVCDGNGRPTALAPSGATNTCVGRAQQVQVVDLSSGVQLRGKIQLTLDPWGWYGWGFAGCFAYDWFWGGEVVQVGGDALAFRRWEPIYDANNGMFVDVNSALWVVDLKKPDAPATASVTIVDDPQAWWGNMQVVGNDLYTGHYEWFDRTPASGQDATVRYFADRIDLSDRAHPKVGAKINLPGLLVGGSPTDTSLLYTIDYRWDDASHVAHDDFNVVRVSGGRGELVSSTSLDGWVGSTFVRGNLAYLSAQQYGDPNSLGSGASVNLHALDLTNPGAPVDRVSTSAHGWGWLLDVQGDRAVLTSGWGPNGVDIYQLADGKAPQFRQFTRTLGWWSNGVSRQGNTLYLSSGYWGVQKVDLQ